MKNKCCSLNSGKLLHSVDLCMLSDANNKRCECVGDAIFGSGGCCWNILALLCETLRRPIGRPVGIANNDCETEIGQGDGLPRNTTGNGRRRGWSCV
jgi:hypothetical protein